MINADGSQAEKRIAAFNKLRAKTVWQASVSASGVVRCVNWRGDERSKYTPDVCVPVALSFGRA
jgi:hypothetical protein